MISAAFIAFYCSLVHEFEVCIPGTYWKILLVCKDEEKGIAEFILVEHALKFFTGLDNTISIVGIDHEDDTLGVLEIMSP